MKKSMNQLVKGDWSDQQNQLCFHLALRQNRCRYRRDTNNAPDNVEPKKINGCAGATFALYHHKRTLHAAQLIFLG
jgi:hypothetical protein